VAGPYMQQVDIGARPYGARPYGVFVWRVWV